MRSPVERREAGTPVAVRVLMKRLDCRRIHAGETNRPEPNALSGDLAKVRTPLPTMVSSESRPESLLTAAPARGTIWRPRRRHAVKRSPNPCRTCTLSGSVQKRLNTYTVAAGAAGVSLMALTQPSEAEIVYTPANETINRSSSYSLDLNHDGTVDFIIANHAGEWGSGAGTEQVLLVQAGKSNQVNCAYSFCLSTFIYAAALRRGTQIGQPQRRHGWLGHEAIMADQILVNGSAVYFNSWANVTNQYLGLRFQINGEVHFGWARLSVKFHGGLPAERTWEAHLTGYAYETVAGKAITAGQTSGNTSEDEEQSNASFQTKPLEAIGFSALGKLGLGASGLALWRREDPESGTKPEKL